MKSTMKRSLAALLTLVMLFSMFAVSIQSVVAASTEDNDPCTCDKDLYAPLQEVVAPTCKDYGGTWNTCPNCGDVWVTDFQNKTDDHNWSEATEPTCTEPGNSGGECTVCGIANPDGTSLPAYGHVYPDNWADESLRGEDAWYMIAEDAGDCTTDGLKTFKCALCQATEEREEEAPGHDHVLNETDYKAPNCTEKGYTRYACSACELKVEVSYNALGHDFATEGKAPTCFESGYLAAGSVTGKANDGYCTRPQTDKYGNPVGGDWMTAPKCGCSDEAYYLAPLNHSTKIDVPENMLLVDDEGDKWVDLDGDGEITEADELVAVADVCKPGEEKDGYKYFYCPTCAADPKADTPYIKVVDEVDHNWPTTYTTVIQAPTCTVEGIGEYVCEDCGHKENRPIPTTPHEYTTDGAAESAIVYTFKLPNGEWYKVNGIIVWSASATVPAGATGAVAVDWVAQKVATCGGKGIFTHACELCDHVESLVVESEHVSPIFIDNVPATCIKAAHTVYQCTNPDCMEEYEVYAANAKPNGHMNKEGNRIPLDADGKPVAVVIVAANDPTCTQPGTKSIYGCYDQTCELYANINKTAADVETAPAHGHDYENTVEVTVQPNCAHRGFKVMACGICKEYVANGTDKFGGVHVDTVEAWEYRIGKGTENDSAFGEILTADSDHTWNTTTPYTPGYAATCRENGRQDVYECTTCHKLKGGDYIAPLTESRVTTNIAPTCQNNGYIVSYCEHCYDIETFDAAAYAANPAAYVFVDKTDATKTTFHTVTVTLDRDAIANNGGHVIKGAVYQPDGRVDLTNAVTATANNVKNEGSCASEPLNLHNGYYTCKHCEQEIEFYVHLKHTPISAPTCGEASICSECNETIAAKLGHLYDDPNTEGVDTNGIKHTAATCAANGYDTYNCYRCDSKDGDYVAEYAEDGVTALYPRLAHAYNITAATCTADKYCTRTCCKDPTTGRVIAGIKDKNEALSFYAKLGHNYNLEGTDETELEGIKHTAATCQANGYDEYTCYRCGDYKKEMFKANGTTPLYPQKAHKPAKELFDERAATCTTFGFLNHVCEMCGEYYDFAENKFYPAQGHIMVPVAATCETVAYEYCKICNASQSTTQDATPDWKGDYNYKVTGEALKHVLYGEEGEEDVLFENICSDLKDIVDEDGFVTCDRCDVTFDYAESHKKSDPQSTATCHADGYSYWYCTVEGCTEKKITGFDPMKEHEYVDAPNHEDWKVATITEAGMKVQVCTNCNEDPACEECTIKTPYTFDGVVVSAKAENMYGKDYHIVNNGIVAYTISINAAKAEFFSFKVDVEYDTDVLTYIGFNLGTDHVNVFGARVNTIGTAVDAANGTLGFYGFNENPESEEKEDVTLTGEQEFVTVYFRVNADVRSDLASDNAVVESAIKLGTVTVLTADDVKFVDNQIEVATPKTEIEIHKLGDATGDAVLASEDISAIKSHILASTYDARLDINVDGFVSADDLILLAQKYVYTYTYEDICGMNVEFDPALSDAEFDPELA